jgi:ATP-binding cassette subfamily B protein
MFAHISSPTRAIAASEGQIARIGGDCLQSLLEQLPQLEEQLRATACDRERLIFLKTATDWRHRPGRQLRQLLPYLEEVEIPAGEALAHCAPDGHFWLRSGEIRKGERTSAVVGESWGYPDPPPADWIAQTDLQVYKLPKERWDAIAPTNTAERTAPAASNGHHPHGSKGKLPATAKQEDSKSQSPPSDSSSQTIAFPKPTPLSRLGRQLWRRYPYVEQQSSSDCGAACLAMVGRYWGKQLSLNYLRNLAGVGRGGASLQALAKAADNLGFQARPVRASLSRLANQDNPWIAHWQGEHYVVVYWVKGDRVLVADPAKGKHTLPRQEFLSGWTGYGLLLDPTERLNAAPEQKLSLSRYWKALLPYRSLIGQILVVSLLIQVFGLARPLFTQIILDKVVVNQSFASLHVFAVGLLLFGIWSLGLKGVRRYLLDYLSNRLDLTLIGGFINHTLRLPLKFFESRRVGDIITRVQENQKIQRFLIRQVVLAWLDLMMGAVYIGLMLYYNLRLTLLILALVPPIAILTLVSTPFLRRVSRDIFNKMAEQNSLLVEMLTGTSTVKAAAAEREIRWQWEDRFTSSINARFRGQKLSNGLQIASGAINTLGSTALLWYGASLVIQGDLTIGQFVAFNMMIGRVISPFLALAKLWDELQEVFISVERLNDVFETEPEEASDKPMLVLPPLRGEVRFDDVTFRYDEEQERNTLQNISFEVHPGETAAIVGRSGSGKTTLVSLLQGLYHPNSGRIWVDGHDIRHVSPQSLRSQLGVVPQDCFLFSGTILDNIRLYRPEFTLEEVTEVAKLAEAHSFIQNLPLGYNTKVGERGSSLSGGQRQRIAIARALLGEPRILVLDEATSSLDTESERRFQQNLERLSRDRTTFIIAHRLSTVRNADTIIVLDRGVLVERGTHEELMALQGLYYHLAQQQLNL